MLESLGLKVSNCQERMFALPPLNTFISYRKSHERLSLLLVLNEMYNSNTTLSLYITATHTVAAWELRPSDLNTQNHRCLWIYVPAACL